MLRGRFISCAVVTILLFIDACSDRSRSNSDSAPALAPVFPGAPAVNTGWDSDAGSVMIAPFESSVDTVAGIVPGGTDSTVLIVWNAGGPVGGLAFGLFCRGGRVASGGGSSALTFGASKL